MVLYEQGSPSADLSSGDLRHGIERVLDTVGPVKDMLIVPPDITRLQSRAGELTRYAWEYRPDAVRAIVPALGTHLPMDDCEIERMFGAMPRRLFRAHNWRTDCVQAGTIPAGFIREVSEDIVDYEIPVHFNRVLFERRYDCILSISQVVPHEVAGMAGYTKNIVVGLGGVENIHKTHFLGAAYGMERIMGRADSPVRKVLDQAVRSSLRDLPIVHLITVLGMDECGELKVRGFFAGDDGECYFKAVKLSQEVNMHVLEKSLVKVVVHLDPCEFKSTWLGNKSIYRTRMAIADGGELVVLAPGVRIFGEDPQIDRLIRRFGYRGTSATLTAVRHHDELKENLSAAAHLIHGSSEGRFTITYCTGGLERAAVEGAGFGYAPIGEMIERYDPARLTEGHNRMPDGEEIYFISSPGSGLWASRERFGEKRN